MMDSDPSIRFNELVSALKEQDYRLTPQRIELVRLIAESAGHPSAAQLYSRIKTQFPTMSQATVYKTLSLLKEMGQVQEIDLREDSRYDGKRPQPHPHLVCERCHRVIDGEIALDPDGLRQLELRSGYQIHRSQMTFFGTCPDCQQGRG